MLPRRTTPSSGSIPRTRRGAPAEGPWRFPRIDIAPKGEIVGARLDGGPARVRPQRHDQAADLDVDSAASSSRCRHTR